MNKKRFLTLLLVFILGFTFLSSGAVMAAGASSKTATGKTAGAAKTPSLNYKKLIMYKGDHTVLKLSNAGSKKVTWTSSRKSVVSVTSKGKIRAKKVGNCTITAKCAGKKYKCIIRVLSDADYLKYWCRDFGGQIKKMYPKSPYDQVLLAASFISHNFSYGSSSGPVDVLKKGRGTCVSANKLLAVLLKSMGFQAKVRFAAKDNMSRYPSGIFFYSQHHNVRVKIRGKYYYVDATPQMGVLYMSSSKKPIYYANDFFGVMYDKVPGHKS